MSSWDIILGVTGILAIGLGILHFFFPILFDFDGAVLEGNRPIRPFRLGFIHYKTSRQDVRGILWLMNHWASFWIVSTGVCDLLWHEWRDLPFGRWIALWLAFAWLIRAVSQLYVGIRPLDFFFIAFFGSFSLVHLLLFLNLF